MPWRPKHQHEPRRAPPACVQQHRRVPCGRKVFYKSQGYWYSRWSWLWFYWPSCGAGSKRLKPLHPLSSLVEKVRPILRSIKVGGANAGLTPRSERHADLVQFECHMSSRKCSPSASCVFLMPLRCWDWLFRHLVETLCGDFVLVRRAHHAT